MLTKGVSELVEAQEGKILEGYRAVLAGLGIKIGFGGVQDNCSGWAEFESGADFDDEVGVVSLELGNEGLIRLMVIWGRGVLWWGIGVNLAPSHRDSSQEWRSLRVWWRE